MTSPQSAIADLQVVVDVTGKRSSTTVAIGVAKALDAHLTGVAVAFAPILPVYPMAAPIPTEFLVRAREAALNEARTAEAAFTDSAHRAGLVFDTCTFEAMAGAGFTGIVDACRLSDLVVVGQVDPDDPGQFRADLIEALLFEAGVPTLLVPYAGVSAFTSDHALVAWDGSAQAARALRAALPLLAVSAKVTVVMITEPEKWRDGAARTDIVRYLARHGVTADVRRLDSSLHDVGATLLNAVTDEGADWMVMGAYAHSRIRQLLLGGATRAILTAATVPVLMAH